GDSSDLNNGRKGTSVIREKEKQPVTQDIQEPGAVSLKKCREYYPYTINAVLIPGGEESLAREFPHMAAIGFGGTNTTQWLCGGSLISPKYVLTAAHCLMSRQLGPPRYVRLGELDFATEQDDAQPQDFTVKRVIPHPDFRPVSGRYHDIGLIELDRNVKPTRHVSFACLDTVRAHKEPQMIATGWGRTEFSGRTSTHLLKINLDTVSIDQCQRFYQGARREVPRGVVDDLQLCAGGKPDQDTCQGDSGGPLQLRYKRAGSAVYAYTIVGITSLGKACGLSRIPGIYTRVYGYLSWIEGIVWPSF
ncbi:hypothetical protein NQ318_021469, partial [Aromia moschata]